MILGLNAFSNNAGIALYDGKIDLCVEEERFNREKKTKDFPHQALSATIPDQLTASDVELIAWPWSPRRLVREGGRLVLGRPPQSLQLLRPAANPNGCTAMPLLRAIRLRHDLSRHFTERVPPVRFVEHHRAHACLGFFSSPFDDALILVADGYGDSCSISVWRGQGNDLRCVYRNQLVESLGLLYSSVTLHLGYRTVHDEGKVMALASLGSDELVPEFSKIICRAQDGTVHFDFSYLNYQRSGELRPFTRKFVERFGPPRRPGEPLEQRHADLAAALQASLEASLLHIVRHLSAQHSVENLALVGGVALNCVANGRLAREGGFSNVFVPPNPDDGGATLGAAMYAHHCVRGRDRQGPINHAFYGPDHSESEIDRAIAGRPSLRLLDPAERAATLVAAGHTVGWFQGRMEMGPRALGHRSILADPRRADMKNHLNRNVKHRESYRPYAPSILEDAATEWFPGTPPSPYMSFASEVAAKRAHEVPAVLHVDNTARVQTVAAQDNELFHRLISAFAQKTGVPMVVNTSLNDSEPICCTPSDAVRCFDRTNLDALILGDTLVAAPAVLAALQDDVAALKVLG